MRYFLLLICLLISTISSALTLKANAPKRYVVQHGDTLWSIACRYLEHPWEWKQLWRANPNIKNPNRLYAGAVLVLDYYQNTPYIKVLANGTIKLSPNARPQPIDDVVPPIPLGVIRPFLNESLVLDEEILGRAPYVVALMGEHLVGGQGDQVYVKGLHPSPIMPQGATIAYSVFRPGKVYVDPLNQNVLGYNATLVGDAELTAGGEPATIMLTSIVAGVQILDEVLINNSPEFEISFEPQAPSVCVKGVIIDIPYGTFSGVSQEAVGAVIVVNLGVTSGLKPGDVLGLYGKARAVEDPKNHYVPIKLPPERIGEAMVFRTFTKTSFALIIRSTRAVYYMDRVANP